MRIVSSCRRHYAQYFILASDSKRRLPRFKPDFAKPNHLNTTDRAKHVPRLPIYRLPAGLGLANPPAPPPPPTLGPKASNALLILSLLSSSPPPLGVAGSEGGKGVC